MSAKNSKQAFIVCFSPMVRVVIDSEGLTKEEAEDKAVQVAIEKILNRPHEYISYEYLDEIRLDSELPALGSEKTTEEEL